LTSLAKHHKGEFTKMLLIGDSGGGKTGALASLAKAGYKLAIIDCDNGLDILANLLASDKAALERVYYKTVTEPMKAVGGAAIIEKAVAWRRAMDLLSRFKDGEEDLGVTSELGPEWVVVIDSLTFLCQYAINDILQLNRRLNAQPWRSDWGLAQKLVRDFLGLLYSNAFKTNVIVNCHITYIGREVESLDDQGKIVSREEDVKAYPRSLGRALSPDIGTFFNHALLAQSVGQKRKLFTNTQGLVQLKSAAPTKVKGQYDIETGLAEYFKDVR